MAGPGLVGFDLHGKTAGILGTGKIASLKFDAPAALAAARDLLVAWLAQA